MPLSEEELRLLEQMERALVAEDPKLASTLRGTSLRAYARRRAFVAVFFFVLGVVVLMAGAVLRLTVVGIVGFVVMLLSATVALTSWRSQNQPHDAPDVTVPGPFRVIEGGRSRRRLFHRHEPSAPKPAKPRQPHQSMMERIEQRWRQRRERSGF